ncbi:MAG: DUF503 family protein [Actinomycetota bacterium]|nr:DUF503 family protein [Actinomycetota bacterium]
MKVFAGISEYSLDLKSCMSLKDRRSVLKSICDKIGRKKYSCVYQIDDNDHWKSSVILASVLSSSSEGAESCLERVRNIIESTGVDVIRENRWIFCPSDYME